MNKALILFVFLVFNTPLSAQNIFRTACQGNLTRLDSMLSTSKIDVTDNRGRSLLHWAVACKKKAIFDFLIQQGIAINTIDHQGKTPMHMAVRYNNEVCLNLLIELQTNDHWKIEHGGSLMELATLQKNIEILEKFIAGGIDINITNERGSTALEIAQRIGAAEVSEKLISLGADQSLVRQLILREEYMGLNPSESQAQMLAPNFISTEEQEFGSVFNSTGTAFYYGVDNRGKNEIRYSKLEDGQWTKPETILSHERYGYNDPFLSNDETQLFFISNRALDGKGDPKDIDIWYVERVNDGWSEPINAGPNINTNGNEYYISFTNEGTMYFSSDGHPIDSTKYGSHDIYCSKRIDDVFQKPILLDEAINTTDYEADVFVAPDESYLIFCSTRAGGFGRGDLYISFKTTNDEWTSAINMEEKINTSHYEYCPFVSKDGKYLFYTSNQDIYWIGSSIINELRETVIK